MLKLDIFKEIKKQEIVDLVVDMVKVNTNNPPGNELKIAELLGERMRDYGLEVEIATIEENRGNVVGILKGKSSKLALLYSGHLDTVPPGEVQWKYGPHEGKIIGDRIYGRGTADMKGGLAAMIIAVGVLAKAGIKLNGDIIVAGTADEEVNNIGAQYLVNSGKLKNVSAIIISEPTYNNIFIAQKGVLWIEITTYGKTAHGSMPNTGVNAIMSMNYFLSKLSKFKFAYKKHSLLGMPTISVGTIKGGVKTNVVPDKCTITIDIRYLPGMNNILIIEELRDICKSLEETIPNFRIELTIIKNKLPVETDPSEKIIDVALKTAKVAFNRKLIPKGANYFTDACVMVPVIRKPVIILGPGDDKLAHQPNEYVEIPKLIEAVKYFVALPLLYYGYYGKL